MSSHIKKRLYQELSNQKKNLSHAYLILGDAKNLGEELKYFLEKELKIPLAGNPDFFFFSWDLMGIDESRRIQEIESRRSGELGQFFLIQSRSITGEAQNSLLKMFEDPTERTFFFLFLPSLDNILPTLVSRFQVLDCREEEVGDSKEAEKFLGMSFPEREKFISQFLGDKKKKEKADKLGAAAFLFSLEVLLLEKYRDKVSSLFLERLSQSRSFLSDRSSNVKMILEFVSVSLDIFK